MANLIIDDLAESRELDRPAMAKVFGGFASRYLFTMGDPGTSFPGITNFYNITQFIADTLQLNILDQEINIIDSPGATAEILGNQENFSSKEFTVTPFSVLPVL